MTNRVHVLTKKEVLLNNFIEKDFHNFLLPINVLQWISLSPKYQIFGSFITPNGWLIHFTSFFITAYFIAMLVVRLTTVSSSRPKVINSYKNLESTFNFVKHVTMSLHITGHLNNFLTNFFHGFSNVAMVLQIQRSLRSMNVRRDLSKEVLMNWLCGFLTSVAFYWYYVYINCFHRTTCRFVETSTDLCLFGFYTNMLYATRIVAVIKTNIWEWNKQIEMDKRTKLKLSSQYCNRMFEAFSSIMDSYTNFNRVFQETILFFILDTFIHALLYAEVLIIYSQVDPEDSNQMYRNYLLKTFLVLLFWGGTRLAYITILGLQIEQLYIGMDRALAVCSLLLGNSDCSQAEKRLFKNVERLHRARFARLSLLGLFEVDVAITLRLAQVTAAHTIVLLQFALQQKMKALFL